MTDPIAKIERTPALLAAVRRIATEEGMFPCAETSEEVLAVAGKGLQDPNSLTPEEIKTVCASALSQAPGGAA